MKRLNSILALLLMAVFITACGGDKESKSSTADKAPAEVKTFNVAWSHYVGWEAWGYAEHKGIIKKWADKNGIEIKVTLINDYIESINLYTAGKFDACTMTNMDALTIPAVGGIDSTGIIVGDFSNGNDAIVVKNASSVSDLKGRDVKLVEFSVSHYLLSRALDMNGMSEKDIKTINTSDADIAAIFTADKNGAIVTWNPPLMQAMKSEGAKIVFDSSKTPGEIIDMMVVKTNAPDSLKKALAGAWYEVMGIMNGSDEAAKTEALEFMAKESGATLDEFKQQLKTTAMFYTVADAAKFTSSADVEKTMEHVRKFSFDKGLYGNGAKSADLVGMEFDNGNIIGDKNNVKLRFTSKYMKGQ